MKTIALSDVLGITLPTFSLFAGGIGTTQLGNTHLFYDLWIRLTLTDPLYVMILALVAAMGWVVAEFRGRKAPVRIACGIATIALLGLFHVMVSGRLRAEITMRQVALKPIEGHIESGDPEEVSRAIRIHDQELEATGDSFMAAESLLHELGRMWN